MDGICWRVLLLAAFCLSESSGQALNSHINPLWVESGRELLARQGELLGGALPVGYTGGLGGARGALRGSYSNAGALPVAYRSLGSDRRGQYPAGTSLFYLDSAGQLRPVFLGSGGQLPIQPSGYMNPEIGGIPRTNMYPQDQESSYYIKKK